jgi:hypothetical protein
MVHIMFILLGTIIFVFVSSVANKRFHYSDKMIWPPFEIEEVCLCTFVFLYFLCTYCDSHV